MEGSSPRRITHITAAMTSTPIPDQTRLVNLYGPDDFRVDVCPLPPLQEDEVLLRVMVCGICGSDLGYVAAGGLLGPGKEPMPLGHELSAVVVATGPGGAGPALGTRVVVNPVAADNNIGNGGPEGGFADFLRVRNVSRGHCLMPIPDSVDDHCAALVEPLAVALHAVNQGAPTAGDRAAVFGTGPIGLGIIAALKQRGVTDVVAIEPSASRRAVASAMGADAVLDPTAEDVWTLLRGRHGERALYGFPVARTELLFEATGLGSVMQGIVAGAGTDARVIVVGLHKSPVPLDLATVLMKELTLRGAMAYPEQEFAEVIDWLASGAIDPRPMISRRFRLDDFPAAFAHARDPEHGGKVLVDIGC